MTQVQPERAGGLAGRARSAPFTPGAPSNPPELADYPETLAGPVPRTAGGPADPRPSSSSGATPRTTASPRATSSAARSARSPRWSATSRGRPPPSTPTSSRWSAASSTIADVAADYVNCTQCGACELRCPNTLFTGDFYRFRTRTVDVVKAVRALAVESGIHQPQLADLERAHRPAHPRAGARRDAGQPGAGPRLGRGAGHPDRRRDGAVRRLRGRVLPHVRAAGRRPDAAAGRLRVRPDGRAVVLRRPGRRDGLRRPGPAVRPAQPRQLAGHRHQAGARARPARLHQLHRGLPEVLRRGVRHRGRAGRSRCSPSCCAQGRLDADGAGRPGDHLPRPVPAQQAQGHLGRSRARSCAPSRACGSRTSTG